MKNTKRIFALLLTLAMSLALLTGCGGGNGASSEGSGESGGSKELTVYTAFPEAEVAYYFNAFEKATGIKVNSLRLSAGEMLTRVAAEKDNPQASLMFGGSTDNYIAASEQGLLEAYQSPELSNTPETYLDPDGVWNPIYVGAIAFACNKDWFADKGYDYPTSWDDLLDPKYQDMIIMAHPATSGTAYTLNKAMIPTSLATKISENRPGSGIDLIEQGKIQYVISTSTKGRDPHKDSVRLRRKAVGVRPEDSLNQRQKKDSLGKCKVSLIWRTERSEELSRALASIRTRSRMMRPGLLPEAALTWRAKEEVDICRKPLTTSPLNRCSVNRYIPFTALYSRI